VHVVPELNLNASPSQIDIGGKLLIPKAKINIRELPPQAAKPSADTVLIGTERRETDATKVNLRVQLSLGDDVQFSGYGLQTKLKGSLMLIQMPYGILRGEGTLSLVDARYKIYGQTLLVKVGDIIFVGDIENPQLRLEAVRERTSDDVTVGLRATGPAQNPTIELFSNPNMPDQLKLRYLLTGSGSGAAVEDLDAETAAAELALGYILESQLGGKLTRRAGSVLGVEDFKITAGSTDSGGTQVGLSGYLTPKLMVRYGVGVFDSINSLTLQYELTKNLYLEAISSDTDAVDLLWIFDVD
jgi:translocation and assembly module TamB